MKTTKSNPQRFSWCILFLLIMPMVISTINGSLRYLLTLTLEQSILPSILMAIVCLGVFLKYTITKFEFHSHQTVLLLLFWFFIVSISIFSLYTPLANGLMGIGGDAGNHVFLQKSFLIKDPKEYHGFVGLYALNIWLETLFKFNSFESFRASFYIVVVFISFIPPLYWISTTNIINKKSFFFLTVIGLPISYISFFYILCTLLHMNQVDGFFAHVFSMMPVILIWLFYSFIGSSAMRIAGVVFCIFLCRFTYGLNLPDLFIFLGIVFIIECYDQKTPKWLKIIYVPCILGASLCAGVTLNKLMPLIIHDKGGITPPQLFVLIPTLIVANIGMYKLSLHIFKTDNEYPKNMFWIRCVSFPIVINICSCLLILGLIITNHRLEYYAYKYTLMSQILTLLTVTILFPLLFIKYWDKNIFLTQIYNKHIMNQKINFFTNLFFDSKIGQVFIFILFSVLLLLWHSFSIAMINLSILKLKITFFIFIFFILSFYLFLVKKQNKLLKYATLFCLFILVSNFCSLKKQISSYTKRLQKNPVLLALPESYNRFYDKKAFQIINTILAEQKKQFGAYIYPSWPQMNFMNAMFNSLDAYPILFKGEMRELPNHCVFWSDKSSDLDEYRTLENSKDYKIATKISEFTNSSKKECKIYRSEWDIKQHEHLCWLCF